jgi:phage shock protein E
MKSKTTPERPTKGFIENLRTTIRGLRGKLPVSPPEEVARWIKEGAILLDVRTRIEVRNNPVRGATNIPLLQLKGELSKLPRDKAFVTYCLRGGRAERAKNLLQASGFRVINGGGYKAILKILESN